MDDERTLDLFQAWFVKPLAVLKEVVGEDAGWVALLVTLPLYERWVDWKRSNLSNHSIFQIIAADLSLSKEQAEQFWHLMRDGLAHKGMPKDLSKERNK